MLDWKHWDVGELAVLPGGICIVIERKGEMEYHVRLGATVSSEKYAYLCEAKRASIAFARKILGEALELLDKEDADVRYGMADGR